MTIVEREPLELETGEIVDHPDLQDIAVASHVEVWLRYKEPRIIREITQVAIELLRKKGMAQFPRELQSRRMLAEIEALQSRLEQDESQPCTQEQRTYWAQIGHALNGIDDVGGLEPPLDPTQRLRFGIFHAIAGVLPEDDAI